MPERLTLSDIGSYASLVGLVISSLTIIYAGLINNKVKEIENRHLFSKRYREHLKTLDETLEAINRELNYTRRDYAKIQLLFVEAIPNLASVANKINNHDISSKITVISKSLHFFRRANISIAAEEPTLIKKLMINIGLQSSITIAGIHRVRNELNLARNYLDQLSRDLKGGAR